MILFHKCLKWYCLSSEEMADYKNTASDEQLIKFGGIKILILKEEGHGLHLRNRVKFWGRAEFG